MPTAVLQPTPMTGWAPGTRHYATDDGHHFAVLFDDGIPDEKIELVQDVLNTLIEEDSGDGEYQPPVEPARAPVWPRGVTKITVAPTVIVECNPDGTPIDLTPLFSFPPSTSYENALALAGYTIGDTDG